MIRFCVFAFASILGLNSVSFAQEQVPTTEVVADGETIAVPVAVVEAIDTLAAETDPSTESMSVPEKIFKIINYRAALNASIEKALDQKPELAVLTFAGVELASLATCSSFGYEADKCAYHQGLSIGRKYVQSITVNRWVDNAFKNKKGKKNDAAKFLLKQAGRFALESGQAALENKWGIRQRKTFLEYHILGTIDGAAFAALRSTQALPGLKP